MQAILSYDRSPPIAAPFRFFLTAPVFGVAAGALLTYAGGSSLSSRWTPELLAMTHLLTAGFMLQVMIGALIQILPVVVGANIGRPGRVAALVHALFTFGTLLLAAAFLSFSPALFILASACFIAGGVLFIVVSARAMRGIAVTGPTAGGLRAAVFGLALTVLLGVLMALSMAGLGQLPLMQLADIHLGWGLFVWALGLLAAVAYVVVPMFQITPNYPAWLANHLVRVLVVAALLWTGADLAGLEVPAQASALVLALTTTTFAATTLILQRRSRRPRFDASQYCWSLGLLCMLAAIGTWLGSRVLPAFDAWPQWTVLCGILLVYGGFVSIIIGMLYKIVPFLTWLHLQNLGKGVLLAPNMKKIIDERSMNVQVASHALACAVLVLAVIQPEWLALPAGMLVVASQLALLRNLWRAVRVFVVHRARILDKIREKAMATPPPSRVSGHGHT